MRHWKQTMFEVLRLMLLLLACLTATLTVEVEDKGTTCPDERRTLQNIPDLKRDCYAALSLVPNTTIEADPQDMAMNQGSLPLLSLRLIGKETYRINGDKIRLPALFMSGNCLITVSGDVKDKPGNQALFSHIYFWPQVRKQVRSIIDTCLGPSTSSGNNVVYWSIIGYSDSRFHTGHDIPAELYTELHIRSMRNNPVLMENSSIPFFTERDVMKFREYNVYTRTGLINDARWETPFERPTAPVTVVEAGTRCLSGSRRLLNKEFLESQCNAALSLVPKSKRDIDLQQYGTDPRSGKLIEKEYQINGDKIRLPAVFISEYCLVQVFWLHEHIGHKRRREVLFNNIYVWPNIYKQVRKIIKGCLGLPVVDIKKVYWSPIGGFQTKIYMEDEFPADIMTYVNVRPFKPTDPGNSKNPYFTEVELSEYRDFNVYTPAGQIHDPRWENPFQRPPVEGNLRLEP
jgi:hypothetical protein